MSAYQIEVDDLAIGLTKPAIKLGVPFTALFLSILICFLSWMLYHALALSSDIASAVIATVIWLVMYGWMVWITSKDVFGLPIFWVNFRHFNQHRTFAFWGNTDSYRP